MTFKKMGILLTLLLSLTASAQANAGLWDQFTDWVSDVTNEVVEFVEDVGNFFVETGEAIADALSSLFDSIKRFFYGLFKTVVATYRDVREEVSSWFTTDGNNSEDPAQLWTVANYLEGEASDIILAEFRQRQADYIDRSDNADISNNMVLRSFLSLPISASVIESELDGLLEDKNPDFRLINLMRVLAYSDEHDELILPVLAQLPFWLPEDDGTRVYTSENHALMWMSSAWILYELEGWSVGDDARDRLVRYLEVKNEYGFYEFFSRTYSAFTLSALLNLHDLVVDEQVKELAGKAALVLLNDLVLTTNDAGIALSVAGRAYSRNFTSDSYYGGDYADTIALITGLGEEPINGGNKFDMLAITELDVSPVIDNFRSELNISYQLGHSIYDVDDIWADVSQLDKVIFTLSAGAYGHPELWDDIIELGIDNVIKSQFLNEFSTDLLEILLVLFDDVLGLGDPFTTSSIITGETIDIYKHGNSMLSSLQNYFPGYAGWQQQPWIATAGTHPIYTRTGSGRGGWSAGGSSGNSMLNTHLPYIKQNGHVALVLYKAHTVLRLADGLLHDVIDFQTEPVNLYWPAEYLDETVEWDNWLFGREGDHYVGVLRHCTDTKLIEKNDEEVEIFSCNQHEQVWASVVGNGTTHGSFSDFMITMSEAIVKSKWSWSWKKFKHVWETTLEVDGVAISHDWDANLGDLSDQNRWELAGLTDAGSIETAQMSGFQVNDVTESWVQGNAQLCEDTFKLHQNVSFNGTDPSVTRMDDAANDACYVRIQEGQSQDDELEHSAETVDVITISNELFAGGEAGKIEEVTDQWQTVDLTYSYTNPVVLASIVTSNGSDQSTVMIKDIASNSFDLRVAEFEYQDGVHSNPETIHYVVMEAGSYSLSNGLTVKVDSVLLETDFDGSPNFESVALELSNYLLVAQIQGANSPVVMDTRITEKMTGSFDMSLMVQEADRDSGANVSAIVGYLAVGTQSAISTKLALKSDHNTYFVAENNGGENVNANRTAIGSWETFVMTGNNTQGCLVNGDSITIQTTSGYYLTATSGGDLRANAVVKAEHETFTLVNHSDDSGCMEEGDEISLLTHHNTYVVAESSGGANANRTAIGSWEIIVVDFL
jgi:hypothetical protein